MKSESGTCLCGSNMSISIQANFLSTDGSILMTCAASGPPGKQQEFSISTPVVEIPGNVKVNLRSSDGKHTSIER